MKENGTAYLPLAGIVLAAASVLLVPLLAMQITDEMAWDLFDFAFAGALLVGTGVSFELAARKRDDAVYRLAVGLALAAAFLLVWASGAVGVIGAAGDDADLVYAGVLAVGITGVFVARLDAGGMARALFATAAAQASVAAIAVLAGWDAPASPSLEIVAANGLFVALFLGSGWLFRKAAREGAPVGATAAGRTAE